MPPDSSSRGHKNEMRTIRTNVNGRISGLTTLPKKQGDLTSPSENMREK